MKSEYINFEALAAEYQEVSREEAHKEIKRENEMRRKMYAIWVRDKPQKLAEFQRQYKHSAAAEKILSVMTDIEFFNLKKRFEQREKDLNGHFQFDLFSE